MSLIPLIFRTARTSAHEGWQRFWLARDRFLADHMRRRGTGFPFATYRTPALAEPIELALAPEDLRHHALVLGSTGSGKSSLLELLARAALTQRQGLALLDLHGDLYLRTAAWALDAPHRDLILLDFTQPALLPSWNPLQRLPDVDPGRQVDLLIGVLKRLYADEVAASWAWGVKVEEILRQTLRALIESTRPTTLLDLAPFLLVPAVRWSILASASPETRSYFLTRFGAREQMYVSAVLNKMDPFLGSLAVQRFLGQPASTVDLMGCLTPRTVLLVNLAKGYLGPTAEVLGRLILNVLALAALRRTTQPISARTPFALLLDEAHALAGPESGLEALLVAARKFRVSVSLAAQSLSLFPPRSRPHLLGNTARQYLFRLPMSEARLLAPDAFEPLGSVYRPAIRPTDTLEDPLLTPAEEERAFTKEMANLPTGACIWVSKTRRYKGRRIQVHPPPDLPWTHGVLLKRLEERMLARKRPPAGDDRGDVPF